MVRGSMTMKNNCSINIYQNIIMKIIYHNFLHNLAQWRVIDGYH